jgi:hypothetical protein
MASKSNIDWSRFSFVQIVLMVGAVACFSFAAMAFSAWLVGIVLSWFGVYLSFWQNMLIVFVAGLLFGGGKVS